MLKPGKMDGPQWMDGEDMVLSQNSGQPVGGGIPGGSSSVPETPQDTGAYIKGHRHNFTHRVCGAFNSNDRPPCSCKYS